MTDTHYIWRMVVVTTLLAAVWLGLGSRLCFLHLGPNERIHSKVTSIRKVEQEINGRRGRILDCNGNILALDLAVKNVCVDPKVISENGHQKSIAFYLSKLLRIDQAMVLSKVNRPNRRFEYIKKYVHEDQVDTLKKMQFKGVFFEDVSARYYPQTTLMSHVIGFSNLEGVGSAGIELKWNSYLKGSPGLRVSEKDGHRHELYNRRSLEIEPQDGSDVYVTLDQHVQYMVERALDQAMETHHAKSAWAVVQRVKTGEILALVSRPDYDLNDFRHAKSEQMLNRAIGYVYEPGSTFKMAVVAAALNEGTVTPDDIFDCENGCWFFKGRPLRDYHAYDKLSVRDVIKKSSNIGAAKIALTLGDKRLLAYLKNFGFGSTTGIDLPGEESGILHPLSRWTSISISRIAMGHEVGVTAMQMLNLLCMIGNDGFLMRPMLVKKVVDTQGRTIATFEPEVLARPIREDTAREMCKILGRVTEPGGTGRRARIEGYTVGGKTGTAQKPIPGGYSDDANIASFAGLIPAEQPEIGIVVVVDEPQPLHTGGTVSAPIFQEIASQLVRYLDIPPTGSEPMHFAEQNTSHDHSWSL